MKRIKITGSKKIMKRPPGQDHFNAKTSGNVTRAKRGDKRAPRELVYTSKVLISKM